jgi:hypothetical protein
MFEPFTPAEFQKQTGMDATENEAIRWVNTQINYANYQNMRQMSEALKEILERLKDPSLSGGDGKYPFSK